MAKTPTKELQETMRVMGRLAAMPHKPHVAKNIKLKKKPKDAKRRNADS